MNLSIKVEKSSKHAKNELSKSESEEAKVLELGLEEHIDDSMNNDVNPKW